MKNLFLKSILLLLSYSILQPIAHANQNTIRTTLSITDDSNNTRSHRIVFSEGLGYTTGFDRGYDAGAFGGEAPGTGFQDRFENNLAIYSLLVDDDLGTELGLTIQSLPFSKMGDIIVPLGINPSKNDIISIKADIYDFFGDTINFPEEHNLILEDRKLNIFTELQEVGSQYEVSLTENEPELGRFYLYSTSSSTQELFLLASQKVNSKKSKSYRVFGCRDKKAKNYNRFSKHIPSKCDYGNDLVNKETSIDELNLNNQENFCQLWFNRLLKKGMKGEDVRQVQNCISLWGYDIGPKDGIFGNLTHSSVISYQSANGLLVDGIVGLQTINHLNENAL